MPPKSSSTSLPRQLHVLPLKKKLKSKESKVTKQKTQRQEMPKQTKNHYRRKLGFFLRPFRGIVYCLSKALVGLLLGLAKGSFQLLVVTLVSQILGTGMDSRTCSYKIQLRLLPSAFHPCQWWFGIPGYFGMRVWQWLGFHVVLSCWQKWQFHRHLWHYKHEKACYIAKDSAHNKESSRSQTSMIARLVSDRIKLAQHLFTKPLQLCEQTHLTP